MKPPRRSSWLGDRFTERPAPHGPASEVDQRIGQLLRQLPPPPPLSPTSLAKVGAWLDAPSPRRPRLLRLALLSALVVLGSSSVVYARRQIGELLSHVGAALGITPTHTAAPPPRRPRLHLPPGTSTPASAVDISPAGSDARPSTSPTRASAAPPASARADGNHDRDGHPADEIAAAPGAVDPTARRPPTGRL